jgi:hypothetical protein
MNFCDFSSPKNGPTVDTVTRTSAGREMVAPLLLDGIITVGTQSLARGNKQPGAELKLL